MKKIVFLVIAFFAIQIISAQETAIGSNNNVYNNGGIEVKPEFPGGIEKFYQFIGDNYKTPTAVDFLGGKVYGTFIIEKEGSLTDIKVLRDMDLVLVRKQYEY